MRVSKKVAYTALPVVLLVVFISCGYLSHKLYTRVMKHEKEQNERIALCTELYIRQQKCNLDRSKHDVLCIGNSITLHLPLNAVNWYSSHGMAASSPTQDYCHLLESKLKLLNDSSSVTPINIAAWERDFSTDLDSLLHDACIGKDIIVIRLGENVHDVENFPDALSALIEYCRKYTNNIILTGEYWPDNEKERAIMSNARKYDLKFVPLDWIWKLYREECSPKEGDILYDTLNQPYKIKGTFIITHPNDKGMEMIATSIYNALQ